MACYVALINPHTLLLTQHVPILLQHRVVCGTHITMQLMDMWSPRDHVMMLTAMDM